MENKVEVIKKAKHSKNSSNGQLDKIKVAAYCRVSTGNEEQLNSYESQKTYYNNLIKNHKEWEFVDIYADEAITGTKVDARKDFQRMINDAKNKKIDLILCKSISRFARNTLDTLKYVRELKAKNVEIFFEEENIKTLSMDGELLLTILSSVAQQEVQNISEHVKSGLRHKIVDGQVIAFSGCLGYDYDKNTKSIVVNEEEAEIVRYIFRRYVEGAGARVIGHELEEKGYLTKRGNPTWHESTVKGIIRNEKYIGDLLTGKTFTVDPISKRRLKNKGEDDKYLVRKNHTAIISDEIFYEAQRIADQRKTNRALDGLEERTVYSRKYAFSSKLECGFCGSMLSRVKWHVNSPHEKYLWKCIKYLKRGRKECAHSAAIQEDMIEKAFVESYQKLMDMKDVDLNSFLKRIEKSLGDKVLDKELDDIDKEIKKRESDLSKLVDLLMDGKIMNDVYETKYAQITGEIAYLKEEKIIVAEKVEIKSLSKNRIEKFRKAIESNKNITEFDPYLFEAVIDKVIVGKVEEDGTPNPRHLIFVYKTGMNNEVDSAKYRIDRRYKNGLYNSDINEASALQQQTDKQHMWRQLY